MTMQPRTVRLLRRVIVVLVATAAIVALLTGEMPASATSGMDRHGADNVVAGLVDAPRPTVFGALGQGDTRLDACGPGVCGSITWSFLDKFVLFDASSSVKDTRCDLHNVYIEMRVHDAGGVTTVFQTGNDRGCHAPAVVVNNQRYQSRTIIDGVQVRACVDDFGSDTCYFSHFLDNPNS
jgi:hypothetical protein